MFGYKHGSSPFYQWVNVSFPAKNAYRQCSQRMDLKVLTIFRAGDGVCCWYITCQSQRFLSVFVRPQHGLWPLTKMSKKIPEKSMKTKSNHHNKTPKQGEINNKPLLSCLFSPRRSNCLRSTILVTNSEKTRCLEGVGPVWLVSSYVLFVVRLETDLFKKVTGWCLKTATKLKDQTFYSRSRGLNKCGDVVIFCFFASCWCSVLCCFCLVSFSS